MNLQFEPIWAWPLAIVACSAMIVILLAGYPRRIQKVAKRWRRALLLLRLLTVVILCLMTLRPAIVIQSQDNSDSVLYLLLDASRSMQTTDLPDGESRRSGLLKTLASAESSLEKIRRKAEVRIRDFSEGLTAASPPTPNADGRMTAFGNVLEQVRDEAGQARVAGVIVLSDGRQAASGSNDSDPLQAARLAGRQQRPLYTVGYGSSEAVTAGQDLALEELDLSRDVFQGNVVPIRVRLKSGGAEGKPVRVRAFLEDRTGILPGTSGPMKPVEATAESMAVVSHTPASGSEEVTLQLRVIPDTPGELKLAVEAEPLPGEVRRTNNRVETIIRVRKGGIRVAYFDILRPEQKWLRQINVSNRVQLDFQLISSGQFADRNRIRDDFFVLGNYDAFIIGNVPASVFRPQQLKALADCCTQGAGLMMTGGFQSFGPGGYGDTPLALLLPVELTKNDPQLSDPIQMLPTTNGLASFVMQIAAPDQNRERWQGLPPLSGASLIRPRERSGAQILAAGEDGTPLLISQSVGASRVLAFAGDTTWQWALQGHPEEHQRFWRQVIFWLTRKENDTQQRVWINADQRDLSPGQPALFSFGARDEQGNALPDASYELELLTPSQKKLPLIARKTSEGGVADFSDTSESGDYWVRVHATVAGKAVDSDPWTRFHVNSRDPELDDPAADPGMLRELAHLSGGNFLTPEELLKRLETWADTGLPGMELRRTQRTSLWDNWYVLGILVALLTFEWAIRKRRGLA
ncbi:MAG: glutamine amidotransferase [Planctomyces sp.]